MLDATHCEKVKLEVYTATMAIYQMMAERRDQQLFQCFYRLLRDFAFQSLKIADFKSETEAIEHLFRSCFLSWLDSPMYSLAPLSLNEADYKIAITERFATLVSASNDWPIVFIGKDEAAGQDEPANFVFSLIDDKWVPSLFWQGAFYDAAM